MNWIKVQDGLPEKQLGNQSIAVLCCTMGKNENEWFDASYDHYTEEWIAHGFDQVIHNVTHWAIVELPV
jgi:hypothetical protein